MAAWILAAAVVWPVVLGGALTAEALGRPSVASGLVYVAASRLCHQRPDRSFHTAGVQWPVCGRCAGLYLGAWLAVPGVRRWRASLAPAALRILVVATAPTLAAIGLERAGVPVTTWLRAAAAVPAGAGILVAVIGALSTDRVDAIR